LTIKTTQIKNNFIMNIYLPTLKTGWISIDEARHLHSLRPKIGDIYSFTNLNGGFGQAKILEINKKLSSYNIEFLEVETIQKPPEKILFQHQTDKLYLEKLMELMPIAGVTKIYIYSGDFSPKQNLQTERLTKILTRSCEQSQNLFLPEIELLDKQTWQQKIKEQNPKWLHQTVEMEVVVAAIADRHIADRHIADRHIADRHITNHQKEKTQEKYPWKGVKPSGLGVVSCLAGPEGGFSQKEEELYTCLNLEKVQLGQNILPAWLAGYTFFANKM
jgi:RsmE family RNA methyltransferase